MTEAKLGEIFLRSKGKKERVSAGRRGSDVFGTTLQ